MLSLGLNAPGSGQAGPAGGQMRPLISPLFLLQRGLRHDQQHVRGGKVREVSELHAQGCERPGRLNHMTRPAYARGGEGILGASS